MSTEFRYSLPVQIRFKDVDALGHVNNANHLTYFELARVHYFDEIINEPIDWSKQGIILARMEIDYLFPILLTDEIRVYARTSRFGTKSFDMEYKIIKKINGKEEIVAVGKSIQVCYNYDTKETIPVPESWKNKVKNYEPQFK